MSHSVGSWIMTIIDATLIQCNGLSGALSLVEIIILDREFIFIIDNCASFEVAHKLLCAH